MTKRDIVIELSKAYVNDYIKTVQISDNFEQYGICFEIENTYTRCVEKILNEFHFFLTEYLLEFIENSYVVIDSKYCEDIEGIIAALEEE